MCATYPIPICSYISTDVIKKKKRKCSCLTILFYVNTLKMYSPAALTDNY